MAQMNFHYKRAYYWTEGPGSKLCVRPGVARDGHGARLARDALFSPWPPGNMHPALAAGNMPPAMPAWQYAPSPGPRQHVPFLDTTPEGGYSCQTMRAPGMGNYARWGSRRCTPACSTPSAWTMVRTPTPCLPIRHWASDLAMSPVCPSG